MSKIVQMTSLPHLDSRGGFTVKVVTELESGFKGWGAVPKGATPEKLKRLGIKLIEEEEDPYASSVEQYVANFNRDLAPKIVGLEATHQQIIDELLLDYNTRDYWALYGINVMLAASIAVARAAAAEKRIELFEYVAVSFGSFPLATMPVPMTTVVEGGPRIGNDLDIQAIMLVPIGALSVDEAHRMTDAVFFKLRDIMQKKNPPLNTSVGEQGGFVPRLGAIGKRRADGWRHITLTILNLIAEAVDSCRLSLGRDFCLALDCAMSAQVYDPESSQYTLVKSAKHLQNHIKEEEDPVISTEELVEFYGQIADSHAVWSIEDGLHREDVSGWQLLTQRLGSKTQLIGDDLFYDFEGILSPRNLLRKNADVEIANAILIMPNRVGTLTSTISLVNLARSVDYTAVMSVRARETEDDAIVDIAAACGVPQVKLGGLQCTERNSKYDRLRLIEELCGPTTTYGVRSLLARVKSRMS